MNLLSYPISGNIFISRVQKLCKNKAFSKTHKKHPIGSNAYDIGVS
jgi:hypothetical protein